MHSFVCICCKQPFQSPAKNARHCQKHACQRHRKNTARNTLKQKSHIIIIRTRGVFPDIIKPMEKPVESVQKPKIKPQQIVSLQPEKPKIIVNPTIYKEVNGIQMVFRNMHGDEMEND